jgi:predicted nucleotidyltransferase
MTKIHRDVDVLIKDFRKQLELILADKFYGLYLYNSVAMGNFEPLYSDIDFTVILNDKLTSIEVGALRDLHRSYGLNYTYGGKLDGMYLQYHMLGKLNEDIGKYPYVSGAKLYEAGYYDINYVTWWSLKTYEMAIASPSIVEALSEVNFSHVEQTMVYNLDEYWLPKLERPDLFEDDMWVEFAVVTLSRIIYTLEHGDLIGKTSACQYILDVHDEWPDIINEALAIRNLKGQTVICDIDLRRDQTIAFMDEMIHYGKTLLDEVKY